MANFNLLSIRLLADSFTAHEVAQGKVFAIFGRAETLTTIQAFLKAIGRDYCGTLFGATLVESEAVPVSCIVVGAHEDGFPEPEDFHLALSYGLSGQEIPTYNCETPRPSSWGSLVRLT